MIHWLQYDGMMNKQERTEKQLAELQRYLQENPTAKATGYFKTTGDVFAKVVRLECHQNYQDLDIECNSLGDDSLRHFDRKPSGLELSIYVTEVINGNNPK